MNDTISKISYPAMILYVYNIIDGSNISDCSSGMRLKFSQKSWNCDFSVIPDFQSTYILLEMYRSQSQLSVELRIVKIGPVSMVWFLTFKSSTEKCLVHGIQPNSRPGTHRPVAQVIAVLSQHSKQQGFMYRWLKYMQIFLSYFNHTIHILINHVGASCSPQN